MHIPPLLRTRHVTRNLNQVHDEQSAVGDRLADSLARFGGSWTFIVVFVVVLILWMGLNSLQLLVAPFDPYPFVFLNLVLSCLAAIQAPVILMGQNRQAARDRLAAELDYACNVKAELEVERLHEKLDLLREKELVDVIELQRQQLELLVQLLGLPAARARSDGQDGDDHDGIGHDGDGRRAVTDGARLSTIAADDALPPSAAGGADGLDAGPWGDKRTDLADGPPDRETVRDGARESAYDPSRAGARRPARRPRVARSPASHQRGTPPGGPG